MRASILGALFGCLVAGCEGAERQPTLTQEAALGGSVCQVFVGVNDDRAELYEFARTHDGFACQEDATASILIPQVADCEQGFERFPERRTIAIAEASRLLGTCNAAFEPKPPSGRHSAIISLSHPIPPLVAREFHIRLQDLALRVPFGSQFIWAEGGFYCFQFDDKSTFTKYLDEVREYLPDKATVAYREGGVCQSQHLLWSRRAE